MDIHSKAATESYRSGYDAIDWSKKADKEPIIDPAKNTRRVERRRREDEDWQHVSMLDLDIGDTFRMFGADGTRVIDSQGRDKWIVSGSPVVVDSVIGVEVRLYDIDGQEQD